MKGYILSDNFLLEEFTQSQYADRHGISMEPPQWVINNLTQLAQNVLEPIRKIFNRPLIITSGYRPEQVNSGIGGSKRSKHRLGLAADFKIPDLDLKTVAKIIALLGDKLNFDQLIFEHNWIHIQIAENPNENRRMILTAVFENGSVRYDGGIV